MYFVNKKRKEDDVLIRLFRFLGRKWGLLLVAVGAIFIQCMCDLYLPTLMSDIIEKGILANNESFIYSQGITMLIYTGIGAVSAIVASLLMSVVASEIARGIRGAMFDKVISGSADQINQFGTSSLITRTSNDVTQVQQLMNMMRMFLMAPIWSVGGIIMAVRNAPSLSWMIVVIVGVVLLMLGIMMIFVMPLFKRVQKKIDNLTRIMREALTGVRVIRAFNKENYEHRRFDAANKDLFSLSLRIGRTLSVLMPIMFFIMNVTSIWIVWVGGHQVEAGTLNMGQIAAFIQYAMQIMFGVMMVAMMFVMFPRAQVSAERINEVLKSQNTIPNHEGGHASAGSAALVFEDVTFSFKGAQMPVLKNISFEAAAGKTTAIIGSTGSGKSTLIDLIPRFYDVDSGHIKINGNDLNDYSIEELRGKIGLVPQKAVLFSGTVRDNIKVGLQGATDEQITEALNTAELEHFMSEKPEGLDARISQGGANLSGGQKQRMAIARALVRKPDIYIFDDSFSALDFKTDAKLRKSLKDSIGSSIMIVVAQRVSTILDADQILVLDQGELVGKGTHKELYENCEVYRQIVESQLSKEEIA